MCRSRKYPYSPIEGIGISCEWEGTVSKTFKFPDGRVRGGDLRKNPFCEGGMDILNYTITLGLEAISSNPTLGI